jgi:hypothetical protein
MGHIRSQGVAKVHIGQARRGGEASPLQTLNRDIEHAGATGLQVVVDSDQGENDETETSFRGIFPKLAPGGVYFLEDIMRSTWGRPSSMRLIWKEAKIAYTPLAISATMATAATGIDGSMDLTRLEADHALTAIRGVEDPPDFWASSLLWAHDLLQNLKGLFSDSTKDDNEDVVNKAWLWYEDLKFSSGRMVDFVECSPGICAIQRNLRSESD